MATPLQVFLVSLDGLFRQALARECLAIAGSARCLESDDGMGAMLAPALECMDLVLLDVELVRRHGNAWLTNWRRMVPQGAVLVVDAQNDHTLPAVREAMHDAVRTAYAGPRCGTGARLK